MELTYPINFVGFDRGDRGGEAVTRDGQYLGTWILLIDDEEISGEFRFIPDGSDDVLFSENVAFIDSRVHLGMALSTICHSIRAWHEPRELR